MVTIYDMVSGEFIADHAPATPVQPLDAASCDHQALLMPRLQTVEATGEQPARHALPADLASVSAAAFVASQHD